MIKFLSQNRISILILIFILLTSLVAYSQTYSVKKYVIGSTSETVSNTDNKISSTLGEPAIGKIENANYKINSGFWFPQEQQECNISIFNVTGGGGYCLGGEGVQVGLDSSQTGILYQLKRDGSDVGNPIVGNGNPFSFGEQTEAGTYTVLASDTVNNCELMMNGNAIITILPLPTATISGTTSICAGESAELSVALTGTAPFSLEFSDGFTANDIETSPYVREVSPAQTTEYSITVVSDVNCSSTGTGTATITVNPFPTATISGTTSICAGESAELSVVLTGTAPFSLEFSDGFTANNIETSPYVREASPAQTTEYSITEVSDLNCSNTGTGTATITVNPLPTATISGTTSICAGESAEISVALTGTAPFSLEFSDGFTANNIETSPYIRQVGPAQTTEYSITEVSNLNCSNTGTGAATITVNPLPTATITGTTSICAGESAELSVALTGTAPFSLEFSDGFTANNIETSPYIREVSPAQTIEYSITEVSDLNCSNAGTGTATITVNPLPTATISGTTSICAGESAEISVALTGTAPFSLEFSDGFTANNIETSPYVREASPAQTTEYSITEVSDLNCSNTGTGTATITVNPLPTATITGTTSLCAGESAELSVALTGTAPFSLEFSDGFTANNIENSPYIRQVSPATTTQYSITEVSDVNCSNTGTGAATITVNPLPTATITGTATICFGDSTDLTVALTGTAPWTVTFIDGFIKENILESPYIRTVSPISTYKYEVTNVSDSNSCNNDGIGFARVTVRPLPTATISGTTSICAGESAELSVALTGTAPFSLEFSDGFTANNIETSPYIRQVSPAQTTGYTITEVSDVNCSSTGTGTATITVNPLPTATISGTTSLCAGESAELSVALTGTAPFSLEFSDGFTANNIENSPYIREVSPAQTTEYTITEVSDVNCSNAGTGTATITVNPLPTATITGTTSLCAGESAELSVALTGTAPFSLEFSDGFTANNIENSPYIRQVSPVTTTEYSITEVSDVNCSNTGTGTATITVNPIPTAYNVTGGGSYYEGGEGVEVGLDGSEIGVNYELFVNNETTDLILNGTGNPLNFGNQTIEGVYTITATLAEGNCSSEMLGSAEVIIIPLANQEISINAGWNIISSYINPENSNIEDIFSGMDNLVIVKNGSGQIYNPNQGINQIGDWNIMHGYMVYVTAPATLEIAGTAIVPNETQINLVAGWNLIAYLRNSQMSIETALGSISNSIVLVKDNQGNLYYPGYYLNTICNMQPGKGYWFYMNGPAVLMYPGN